MDLIVDLYVKENALETQIRHAKLKLVMIINIYAISIVFVVTPKYIGSSFLPMFMNGRP